MTTRPYLKGDARTTVRDRAAALYLSGCSIRSVAAQLGRSYGGTYALLREAKVTFRPRGNGRQKADA
ncbi:helix-turn-helix domain-containing protein [Streptomyces turgidiscabies]|uniref:helix-turn-helix domain-containing protein n=1 Tax=Streptomyces turgidiscabies TaxID=85558 RepID=UPI0038F6F765